MCGWLSYEAPSYATSKGRTLIREQIPLLCLDEECQGQQSRQLSAYTAELQAPADDLDDELLKPQQTMIAAIQAPRIKSRAAASIWAVADAIAQDRRVPLGRIGGEKAQHRPEAVSRADGVTRVSGASYPSDRWTAEREEVEQARRLKIRAYVTKNNPAKHRTRGKKLRTLLGESV